MSHHLLSKKIWISVIIMTCMFLGLAYVWMYYTDQFILQAELTMQDSKKAENENQASKITPTEEAALYTQEAIDAEKIEKPYPCVVQMKEGSIGVFAQDGSCLRDLQQVGEWLSETDQTQLMSGIWVENEKELVMVLESYHLQ